AAVEAEIAPSRDDALPVATGVEDVQRRDATEVTREDEQRVAGTLAAGAERDAAEAREVDRGHRRAAEHQHRTRPGIGEARPDLTGDGERLAGAARTAVDDLEMRHRLAAGEAVRRLLPGAAHARSG